MQSTFLDIFQECSTTLRRSSNVWEYSFSAMIPSSWHHRHHGQSVGCAILSSSKTTVPYLFSLSIRDYPQIVKCVVIGLVHKIIVLISTEKQSSIYVIGVPESKKELSTVVHTCCVTGVEMIRLHHALLCKLFGFPDSAGS